jgi:hypothetical protein
MFEAFPGILDGNGLSAENDPDGMRRTYLRELTAFGNSLDPVAALEISASEASVLVRFPHQTDELLRGIRDRYARCFDAGELEGMIDIGQEYVRHAMAAREDVPDGAEAAAPETSRQIVIALSMAVAAHLEGVLTMALHNRLSDAAEIGAEHAENETDWDDDDESWDIGTPMDPDGRAYDAPSFDGETEMDDDDEDDIVGELAMARHLDAEDRADAPEAAPVDPSIVERAKDARADVAIIRGGLLQIAAHLDSDALEKRLAALELLESQGYARCSPAELMAVRLDGELGEFFDRMDENDAAECFESLFEDIAQEALLAVAEFSSRHAAYGENGDAFEGSAGRLMDAYVDALRRLCGMA